VQKLSLECGRVKVVLTRLERTLDPGAQDRDKLRLSLWLDGPINAGADSQEPAPQRIPDIVLEAGGSSVGPGELEFEVALKDLETMVRYCREAIGPGGGLAQRIGDA